MTDRTPDPFGDKPKDRTPLVVGGGLTIILTILTGFLLWLVRCQ